MTGLWLASYIALWVLLLAVTVTVISALRNLGVVYSMIIQSPGFARTSASRTNLNPGEELPEARLVTAAKEPRSVSSFRGSKTAFAVVSATCEACWLFLRSADENGPDQLDPGLRNMVIISLSDPKATAKLMERAGFRRDALLLFDPDDQVRQKWGITTTPAMVVVDERLHVVRQVFGAIARPSAESAVAFELSAGSGNGLRGVPTEVHHG
ncbi:MAG: peroxiredoxin family protein [Solirubrobacteraceae bacterium]